MVYMYYYLIGYGVLTGGCVLAVLQGDNRALHFSCFSVAHNTYVDIQHTHLMPSSMPPHTQPHPN